MASENAKIDDNNKPVAMAVTDDANLYRKMLRIDDATKGLKVMLVGGAGTGTVTSIASGTGILVNPSPIVATGSVSLATALQPMATLTGNALKVLRVNAGETAVEYATISSGLTVGTTAIASGTTTRILYDNAGVLGEYTISGSGTVVAMATAPTFGTSITGSYLTASEILITDGSKNIVSADTATYPSLTELSYVKGVTSGIQTQLNGKQASGTYVTAISIASANGFAGSSSGGATPALTLSTSITGVLKGNGTAISACSNLSDVAYLPLAGGTMTGAITLGENTSLALDPAGSADGKWTGISITATAGYTQAFGDLVYLDPTDSRWEACDANSAAGADGDSRGILGMVVSAGTDGNPCTILLQGVIRADAKFPTFTINNPIYVSETASEVTQTQPTTTDVVIRIVGSALTADEMYFCPDRTWITHT